jgi:hypothetical protein
MAAYSFSTYHTRQHNDVGVELGENGSVIPRPNRKRGEQGLK